VQIRGVFYLFVASQIPTDVDKTSLDHGKTSVGYGSTLVWPEDLGYQMLYRTSSNTF